MEDFESYCLKEFVEAVAELDVSVGVVKNVRSSGGSLWFDHELNDQPTCTVFWVVDEFLGGKTPEEVREIAARELGGNLSIEGAKTFVQVELDKANWVTSWVRVHKQELKDVHTLVAVLNWVDKIQSQVSTRLFERIRLYEYEAREAREWEERGGSVN